MKKRVGALIEEEVIRQAKLHAAQEGRTLDALIQEALVSYLSNKMTTLRKREEAYQLFCEQPMRLTRRQFKEILKEGNFKPL